MRIAHFVMGRCNPDSANGVDKTIYHLSKTQAQEGHAVKLFSLTAKPPIPVPGVEISAYPPRFTVPSFMQNRVGDLLIGRNYFNLPERLLRDMVAWQPDIGHLHFVLVPQNVHVANRLRRHGIPYCVTLNGGLNAASNARNRLAKQVFRSLVERPYLQRAGFVHAISVQDERGVAALRLTNRLVTIPNGIDVKAHATVADPGLLRRRFPQLEGKRVFLFLGRLDPGQKGLDVLLEGLREALAAGDGVDREPALVIVGPDWRGNRAVLEASAEALGIHDHVYFTGPAFGEEKLSLVAGCDVFAHPSRWEAGIPFSVLEASALARPSLVTEGADPGAVLVGAGAAIGAEPTASSIATAIRRFAALSPAELTAMGAQAHSIAERDYSWTSITASMLTAYEEATG